MAQSFSIEQGQERRLFIQTFGCQMNEYDSLRAQQMLASRGCRLTSDIKSADIIFLNTCSVREKAEQKVYSFLGRLRSLKALRPGLKIVVAGCMAQQLGKELLRKFDHLDLVLGTRAIGALPGLLQQIEESNRRIAHLPDTEEADDELALQSFPFDGKVVAPVTIMQGCDNFCSYCIVPYVRGRERSRPSVEILREIEWLVQGGVREVLLLGQNVNSYGRGLEEKIDFVGLLHRIHEVTDVARIRFTTSHPKDFTDELIRSFVEIPVLCHHLHLPFQAGSDRILKRMGRGYTAGQYMEKIEKLRSFCPDIALSADVMVGFPGESEEEFQDTLRLIERVQFDSLFSFRYSDRDYARSTGFPDKIPEETKARRLNELQALQTEITLRRSLAEVGHRREVLVEGPSKAGNGQLTGRTGQNRIVNFGGTEEIIGQIVQVKIVAAFPHSLAGEVVSEQQVP